MFHLNLVTQLGFGSASEALTYFASGLASEQGWELLAVAQTGDEAAAKILLDRVVREIPAEQLLARLRKVSDTSLLGHSQPLTLFSSHRERETPRFLLRGGLSFAELAMELAASLERKDSEASVILLENAGVVTRGVCRILRAELSGLEAGVDQVAVLKKANVFVTHLSHMLVDPNVHEFPDITHHPSPPDVSMLLNLVESRGWVATEIFGRITILTAGEFKIFLLGEVAGIFHPSIKIFSDVKIEATPQRAEPTTVHAPMLASVGVELPVAVNFPTASPPHMEGALMLAPELPAKLQDPTIPYKLLRRVVYRALSEERFEEAARMVENISDEFVLARLFDDLRMKVGDDANHLPHSQLFFGNTAIYAGKMLDAMNPETVVSLLLVLNQHARWHDQKALDQWLLIAFRAVRSRSEEEESSSSRRLPRLSVILGTLMEWEETRELARRLLQTGLNPSHEAYGEIYDALEALHERSEAFLLPFEMESNGFAEIYDEAKAAAELGIEARTRIFKGIAALMGQRAPIAPHFDPPRRSLAGREAVFERLIRKLEVIGGKPEEMPKNLEAISALILFALPPAEVWRLMQAAVEKKEIPASQFLAELLIVQPTEVVLAFFTAWGRGLAEDEDVAPLGRELAALWKLQGEVGPRLVTDVVDAALNDDAAVAVLQRALSQHGTDSELMQDQMEIYVELSERLGEKINSYEIFVTTGVLKPGDLSGQFREMAIGRALKILTDLDAFGKIHVGTRSYYTGDPWVPIGDEYDPSSGISLDERTQAQWHQRATNTLAQLKADEPAVVKYFAVQLGDEANEAFYVLDQLGPRAQKILLKHIQQNSTKMVFDQWMKGARVLEISPMVPTRISINELVKKFPLTSCAMQRYLIERLQKETGIYEKEIKKQGHIDRIVAGEIETPEIIKELAELGDEALILLSIVSRDFVDVRYASGIVELPDPATKLKEITPHLFCLIQMAELIGSEKAHAALVALYQEINRQKVYIHGAHQTKRMILRALARLESKSGYDGPLAVADYLNSDADFMEKLELLDYLENAKPIFDPTAFAQMPFEIRHKKNPFLNKLLGRIINSAFYLFVIRALKDDDMRQTFLNWHYNSDDVGGDIHVFESTRTWPAIIYIAKDESPENLQREIAIHTLFWYFRRVHTCGFRDPLLGVLDPPLMKLLKQIEPTLKELCASGAARYADPEDVYYFRSRAGV